jgi:hypothetical protein
MFRIGAARQKAERLPAASMGNLFEFSEFELRSLCAKPQVTALSPVTLTPKLKSTEHCFRGPARG